MRTIQTSALQFGVSFNVSKYGTGLRSVVLDIFRRKREFQACWESAYPSTGKQGEVSDSFAPSVVVGMRHTALYLRRQGEPSQGKSRELISS